MAQISTSQHYPFSSKRTIKDDFNSGHNMHLTLVHGFRPKLLYMYSSPHLQFVTEQHSQQQQQHQQAETQDPAHNRPHNYGSTIVS